MTRQELEEDNADIHLSLNVISIGIDSESKMIAIPGTNYRMGQTQVTQRLYKKVMGENPSWFQLSNDLLDDDEREALEKVGNTTNNPVENVSWFDALYFCNKLSMMEGLTPAYSVAGETTPEYWDYTPHKCESIDSNVYCNFNSNGYRLPTNDEWEEAAKGGESYTYSGSDDLNEVGWYKDNSNNVTHPVAQKMANGYELYDMSGNVWEWVWETFSFIPVYRCNRGGNYCFNASSCEISHRNSFFANFQNDFMGFRLLRPLITRGTFMSRQELEEDGIDIHSAADVISISVDTDSKMVTIPDTNYRMGQTPVTQRLYKKVMGENPSWFQPNNSELDYYQQNEVGNNTANNPVENVSWFDAIYFCNRLSMKEGLSPAYSVDGETDPKYWSYTPHQEKSIESVVECNFSSNGYRLPTNAEWEKAAKGGENYTYSGSDDLDKVGWYQDNSNNVTHPVAQKIANGYGLYDMSGNVWEWMWDAHPDDPDWRFYRGGGYYGVVEACTVSYRSVDHAYGQHGVIGFRLLRPID